MLICVWCPTPGRACKGPRPVAASNRPACPACCLKWQNIFALPAVCRLPAPQLPTHPSGCPAPLPSLPSWQPCRLHTHSPGCPAPLALLAALLAALPAALLAALPPHLCHAVVSQQQRLQGGQPRHTAGGTGTGSSRARAAVRRLEVEGAPAAVEAAAGSNCCRCSRASRQCPLAASRCSRGSPPPQQQCMPHLAGTAVRPHSRISSTCRQATGRHSNAQLLF